MTKPALLTVDERTELEMLRSRLDRRTSPRRDHLLFGAVSDYGFVVVRDVENETFYLSYYDDDEYESYPRGPGESEECYIYPVLYRMTALPWGDVDGGYCTGYFTDIAPIPEYRESWRSAGRQKSYVYAVMLMPDITFKRIKIGRTTNINERMRSFKVTCPTAILIGLWPGKEPEERQAHRLLEQGGEQIGSSEVFHFRCPWKSMENLHQELTSNHRSAPS